MAMIFYLINQIKVWWTFVSVSMVIYFLFIGNGFSQTSTTKRQLEKSDLTTWRKVTSPLITDDGSYSGYILTDNSRTYNQLIIQCLTSDAKLVIDSVRSYSFTLDSKHLVVSTTNNTVKIYDLKSRVNKFQYSSVGYQLVSHGLDEWLLVFQVNSIRLLNTSTLRSHILSGVQSHFMSNLGNYIALIKAEENRKKMILIDKNDNSEVVIGCFEDVHGIIFSKDDNKIAFLVEEANKPNFIHIYDIKAGRTRILRTDKINPDTTLKISNLLKFSNDEQEVFVTLSHSIKQNLLRDADVKIWNYEDALLVSNVTKSQSSNLLGSISIKSNQLLQLQYKGEIADIIGRNDIVIVDQQKGMDDEAYWNKKAKRSFFVADKSGTGTKLDLYPISISPEDRYIIGFDTSRVEFESFDLVNRQYLSLTAPLKVLGNQKEISRNLRAQWKFQGWLSSGRGLFNDGFDLWVIDPGDPKGARNLTNGYGRKSNISFEPISSLDELSVQTVSGMLLCAFNHATKQNGFYRISENHNCNPIKLIMSDNVYYFPSLGYGEKPVMAKNKRIWLVSKESTSKSKNYLITKDFKTFQPLSNSYPECSYNWLTSELISFKTLEGKASQAVLYKPEDFDASKKYPVIMNYYEQMSNGLNRYLVPEFMFDNINIPWFVTHGYLVCTPDIIYQLGETGKSATSAVEGAARSISSLPYVDSIRLGINGHSHGGWETNDIVTRSKYFKAAVSSSGVSNLISAVTSITKGGGVNFHGPSAEQGQSRIGYSMWERQDLYIDNSPVLKADKVQTPILLMANENDAVVNFDQGIAMFLALRRLEKPVWLLQYPGEAHSLLNPKNQWDWQNKVQEFFDHYLKSRPMPEWMKSQN